MCGEERPEKWRMTAREVPTPPARFPHPNHITSEETVDRDSFDSWSRKRALDLEVTQR